MAKRLEMTERIRGLITSAFEGVNPDEVVAYEAISINSLPVSKKGYLFEGAVHTRQTLEEMALAVSSRPLKMNVPLHTNHDQGYGMPVGKTFHAGVFSENGVDELRSLFYLPKTETDTLSKLDTAVYDEVSIGARYKSLNCSQCGWDYLGATATDDNIWSRTCGNDHAIGTNGVHVMLNGIDRWMEQSLVSLGAATGAKILPNTRALLGEESYNKLLASGISPAATTLFASATKPPQEKDDMDLTQLVKELTDAKTALALSEASLATTKVSLTAAEAKVVELTAANTALTASNATLSALDAVKLAEEAKVAKTAILTEATRLAVAAGVTPLNDTASVLELTASIDSNRKTLSDRFPGGNPKPVVEPTRSNSAFQTRK